VKSRRIDFIGLMGYGGALLFIACLYLSPAQWIPATEVLRPAMLSAVLMLGGVLLNRVRYGVPIQFAGGIGVAMCTLFGFAAMSALWALNPENTKTFTADAIKEVAAFVGIVSIMTAPNRLRAAMLTAVLCSMIPAQGTVERYQNGIDLVEGYRGNWLGHMANPNQLAMIMAVTMPWALFLWTKSKGLWRHILLVAAGLEVSAIVATHSRGGALGLMAAMLAFALLSQNKARAMLLVVLSAIALVVFAPRSFWERTGTIETYQLDASAMGRIKAWETGFKALRDHPILGVGANNYHLSWNVYTPRNIREHAYTAHNMWMQVFVELGLVGMTAFATMFVLILWGLWKARRNPVCGGEARAILASLCALLVCGTTGGYAFNWFFYMVLGLAGTIIVRSREWAQAAEKKEPANGEELALA
jgi:O-antigen ligase